LWNTAFNSIIEILQRFRNEYLRIIVNAPWYVSNDTSHHDVNALYIRGEIRRFSQRYADRLEEHPNVLATDIMRNAKTSRRLKRRLLKTYASNCNFIDLSKSFSHLTATGITKCHIVTACNNS